MAQPRICSLIKMKAPEQNEGYLDASGTTVPADGTHGYQTGCIFKHTDGGEETSLYVNEGSLTSCDFNPIITTSNELQDLPDFGAMTYGAGRILVADGDSYEEVAVGQDATLASNGYLTVVSAYNNFDVGASGRAGTVDIFPTTASKGKLTIQCTDNTDNFGTILTNAANDTSTKTATIPALTGYVGLSTAALSLAEMDRLDGAGTTVVASKAVIADGDKDIVGLRQLWLGTNGAAGFAGQLNVQDGANPGASVSLVYADVALIDGITAGTAAASKCLTLDAYKTARLGGFNTAAAVTDAVPFASVPDTWTDGQLDVFSIFGGSSTNIGSGYSAKCIRARHVVNASDATVEHETYGMVGQLVVKSATLGHLHAGIMGTLEGHTTGVVINGGYTVGAACITARLGGHASITATDPVAGFLAFNNGAAALVSGVSAAFAASSASASYPWVLGLYMPVGSVTQAIRIGAFDGSAATTNAIQFSTSQNLWSDGQLSTAEIFGASASDLTSAYSAKCLRARHIVNATSIAHESYGIMGQLVVKDTTLTHLHSGLIGTFEGHTSGCVVNGAYQYGVGAVTARCGGGAAITATKDLCGYTALWNGAALSSGSSVALAIGDTGTVGWTHGIGVERCTNLLDLPAAGTDPVIANALVPAVAPDGTTVGADACLRVLVNATPYYIPLYDSLHA